MPILCYEITGSASPNQRSTTGALDGQLAAVLKVDHEVAKAQVYAELVANRLAMFLGIPVVVGVPAWQFDVCPRPAGNDGSPGIARTTRAAGFRR